MESVKLHLLMQDVGRILQVLSKQPYDQVADIIEKMKVQIERHVAEDRSRMMGAQAGAQQGDSKAQVNGTDA
jgi:hypothetical protein